MQCLSPSCLWQCFLIFRSQSKCQNCKAFVKIFNDNDKIVVASLKCSDIDSCDCNNQRYCGRTSESQLGLVIIQLPVCVLIYWQICVLIFWDIFPECRRKRGAEQQLSLSWLSSPLTLLLLPTQPEPPHSVTDCPSAGHQLTLPPSRDKYWGETHSWGNTEIHGGEKDRRRKKRKSKKRWWLWHVTSGSTYCTQVFTFSILPHCLSIRHRSSNHFDNLFLLLGKSNWLWNTSCQSTKNLVAFLLLHDHNCSRCSVPDLEIMILNWLLGRVILRKAFPKEMGDTSQD